MIQLFRARYAAPLLAALLTLSACSKNNEASPGGAGMSWKMDGRSESASSTAAEANGNQVLIVGASSGTATTSGPPSRGMAIILPNQVGTYSMDEVEAMYFAANGDEYDAETGTLEVTKATSSTIAGTFSFSMEGSNSTHSVSSGKFNISY
jgi:hypothetical protein